MVVLREGGSEKQGEKKTVMMVARVGEGDDDSEYGKEDGGGEDRFWYIQDRCARGAGCLDIVETHIAACTH